MIRVLIVDDSKVVQEFLSYVLSSDPDIEIAGVAATGIEAIRLVEEKKPDLVTMDIHMPGMDGLMATKIIMETTPTPIVIVSSSLSIKDVAYSFKLIEAGALAVVLRPPGMNDPEFPVAKDELIQQVKLMSDLKVVKRFPNQMKKRVPPSRSISLHEAEKKDYQIIAIGTSTGGPVALQQILSRLPGDFCVPILIVQHIAHGFLTGFVEWLSLSTKLKISIAENGEMIQPGHVYIAPDKYQLGIASGLRIKLSANEGEMEMCPSVDHLFRSVAQVVGERSIGILLTGMGKDGAKELKNLKNRGAITLVQDEKSCVVFGMPGEAVKLDAATKVLTTEQIAAFIHLICEKN